MVSYLETSREVVLGLHVIDVADYTRHLLELVEENRQLQQCLCHISPRHDAEFYEQIQGESSRLVIALKNAASVVQARYGIVLLPAQ